MSVELNEATLNKINDLLEETPHFGDTPKERKNRAGDIKLNKRLRDNARKYAETDSLGKVDKSAGDFYHEKAIKISAANTPQEVINKKEAKSWFPDKARSARGKQ